MIKRELLITTTVVSRTSLWLGGGYVRKFLGGDVPVGPLAYTRASSAEFLLPYTRLNTPNSPNRTVTFRLSCVNLNLLI